MARRRFTVLGGAIYPCGECGSTSFDVLRVIGDGEPMPTEIGNVRSWASRAVNLCRDCRNKPVPVEEPEPPKPRTLRFRTVEGEAAPLQQWPRGCLTCGGGHDLLDVPTTGAESSVVMCRFCRRDAGVPL